MAEPPITQEQQQVAELVRSGAYFKESRAWYQALFIGPISERTFFLIVAGLAVLISFTSVIAVMSLLPVVSRPDQLIKVERMDDVDLRLTRLRAQDAPLNEAMLNFFLKQYVYSREGYELSHYPRDYAFIQAHSDQPTFATYAQAYNVVNPQSPAATLGESGRRHISVDAISVNDKVEPKVAVVKFSTDTVLGNMSTTTQWTATIGFYYSDFVVNTLTDPQTGQLKTQTQEPQFQVVNYALSQAGYAQSP